MRDYAKSDVVEKIRAAGGEIYAVTSEPQSLARNAQDDWETGLEHVGDPHHEITGTCAERGWLSLFTSQWDEGLLDAESTWLSHPKGYFQPGVLALTRERRVLYRWRSRPSRANAGGAVARPTPAHVWSAVERALNTPDAADAALDANPELDHPPVPWPLFVMLLVANGWFLRPRTFDIVPGGESAEARQRVAMIRLIGFVMVWAVAAFLLPAPLVALAFGAWLLKIAPGLRSVHRQFQVVADGEEPA